MLGMNDVKKGKIVVLENQPYVVVSSQFSRKQKSRPVMRSVLRHLQTAQTKEHTFMQSDRIEEADVDRKKYQFLYKDEAGRFVFMDQASFEQLELREDEVGEAVVLLMDGQEVSVVLFDGKIVNVELPIKVDRAVTSAPPGVKGDTTTNVMKEVIVEGGAKIKAPLFISEGDVIKIDTRTREYVERV
jgi:elongation factor P